MLEKNDRLSDQNGELRQQLTGKDAENQLLRMQLEDLQRKSAPAKPQMPTLEQFGYDEQRYAQAMADWVRQDVAPSVFDQKLSELEETRQQEQAKQQRDAALESHYQRADQLKVKDYEATEEAVIGIMGQELVTEIAATVDESANLLYYLGKNPSKAEEFKRMFDENPAKATYALGKFAGGLTVKPASKKSTPAPDTPLNGGGSPGLSWSQRLEKAEKLAEKTGDRTHVVSVKKAAKAAGVNL